MTKELDKKKKIVFIIGENYDSHHINILKLAYKPNEDEIDLIGDGEVPVTKINLEPLKGKTDENTLFILIAHGSNNFSGGMHSIGQKTAHTTTANYLTNLQQIVEHKISVLMPSCHAGGSIKRSEIANDKISLLAISGNKHSIIMTPSIDLSLLFLQDKINGLDNDAVFRNIITKTPETIYYLPFNHQITAKSKKFYKFSRVGKFNIDEIKEILIKNITDIYTQENAIKKFEDCNKTDFSINKIKIILKDLSMNRQGIINDFCNLLQEKLKPDAMSKFLESRCSFAKKDLGQESIVDQSLVVSFWFIAIGRGYEEEVKLLLKNNPKIVNSKMSDGNTALMYVATNNNESMAKILTEHENCNINLTNNSGRPAIIFATLKNSEAVVDILLSKNCNINQLDNNECTAIDYAAKFKHKSIVQKLITKQLHGGGDIMIYKTLDINPTQDRQMKIVRNRDTFILINEVLEEMKHHLDLSSDPRVCIIKGNNNSPDTHLSNLSQMLRNITPLQDNSVQQI